LKQSDIGRVLVFIGIFGGGIIWILACIIHFDYLVHEVYSYDPGEPIWVLDPSFTLLATTPGLFISVLGIAVLTSVPQTERYMNWVFLSSMMLIITGIISAVLVSISCTMLHYTYSIINLVLFGIITATCDITAVYLFVIASKFGTLESVLMQRVRLFYIGIASELILSAIIIIIFQLDTWSAVRRISLLIQLSGWLGVGFLITSWLLYRSHITSKLKDKVQELTAFSL
jgi:hypothetical protein